MSVPVLLSPYLFGSLGGHASISYIMMAAATLYLLRPAVKWEYAPGARCKQVGKNRPREAMLYQLLCVLLVGVPTAFLLLGRSVFFFAGRRGCHVSCVINNLIDPR